jgi:hypothetical protein
MEFRGAVPVKKKREKSCGRCSAILLVPAVFVIIVGVVTPIVSGTAYASNGYACYDKPCSEERKDYVDRWVGRACAFSRSLKRLLERKARGELTRAEIVDRLNRCLARNPGRARRCAFHTRRLRGIDSTLRDIQRRLDRIVARLQASCNSSLPGGIAGNPPTCEEQEALRYCPIADAQQAQRSMEQRCADLRAEQAQQAVCGQCVNPRQLIAAASHSDDLWVIAQARPTCAPVPTFTPLATSTPDATATPESPVTPDSTTTPGPTATPVG